MPRLSHFQPDRAHERQRVALLHDAGVHCYIGPRAEVSVNRLRDHLLALINSPSMLREMSRKAGALFGNETNWGTERVARYLVSRPQRA